MQQGGRVLLRIEAGGEESHERAPEASLLCTIEGFRGGRSSGVGMPSPMDSCKSIFSWGGRGFLGLFIAALAML